MLNKDQIESYFNRVYQLAEKGRGKVAPNPMVGAVVVKNNTIIAEGYHTKHGAPHAERVALQKAANKAKGATLFVNLEPCSHHGMQPPCTDIIIESEIEAVYFSVRDPNPLVQDTDSVELLRKNEIKVHYGFFDEKEHRFNEVFYKNVKENMPFVTTKTASSLDGKLATAKGESQWITGVKSRELVHKLRSEATAVIVGVNTVVKDNPSLNVRLEKKRINQPYRVIVDGKGKTPVNSKVIEQNDDQKTILVLNDDTPTKIINKFKNKGIEVLLIKHKNERPNIKELLKALYKRGIYSVLVEGGGEINHAFLPFTDKFYLFYAPIIIGGHNSIPSFGGSDIKTLSQAYSLKEITNEIIGEDILITAYK